MTSPVECTRCGHCCRESIIEITLADLRRAPELLPHVRPKGRGRWSMVGCPLLTCANLCPIYERRPKECREFRPGSNPLLCPQSPTAVTANGHEPCAAGGQKGLCD